MGSAQMTSGSSEGTPHEKAVCRSMMTRASLARAGTPREACMVIYFEQARGNMVAGTQGPLSIGSAISILRMSFFKEHWGEVGLCGLADRQSLKHLAIGPVIGAA